MKEIGTCEECKFWEKVGDVRGECKRPLSVIGLYCDCDKGRDTVSDFGCIVWERKEPELKPCPFCGKSAKIFNKSEENYNYYCKCINPQCYIITWVSGDTEEEVIAKWNTRA